MRTQALVDERTCFTVISFSAKEVLIQTRHVELVLKQKYIIKIKVVITFIE